MSGKLPKAEWAIVPSLYDFRTPSVCRVMTDGLARSLVAIALPLRPKSPGNPFVMTDYGFCTRHTGCAGCAKRGTNKRGDADEGKKVGLCRDLVGLGGGPLGGGVRECRNREALARSQLVERAGQNNKLHRHSQLKDINTATSRSCSMPGRSRPGRCADTKASRWSSSTTASR